MKPAEVDAPEVTDQKRLRQAFSAFATGVTIVTTGGAVPHAMTANSFASVSLDPPLLLVCVDRGAIMHQSLLAAGRFAVSVLAADQEHVAKHFANRWRSLGADQFTSIYWTPGSVAPLIAGALAHFECDLWQTYDGGDHTVFVGKLRALRHQGGDPILFYGGRFRQVAPLGEAS